MFYATSPTRAHPRTLTDRQAIRAALAASVAKAVLDYEADGQPSTADNVAGAALSDNATGAASSAPAVQAHLAPAAAAAGAAAATVAAAADSSSSSSSAAAGPQPPAAPRARVRKPTRAPVAAPAAAPDATSFVRAGDDGSWGWRLEVVADAVGSAPPPEPAPAPLKRGHKRKAASSDDGDGSGAAVSTTESGTAAVVGRGKYSVPSLRGAYADGCPDCLQSRRHRVLEPASTAAVIADTLASLTPVGPDGSPLLDGAAGSGGGSLLYRAASPAATAALYAANESQVAVLNAELARHPGKGHVRLLLPGRDDGAIAALLAVTGVPDAPPALRTLVALSPAARTSGTFALLVLAGDVTVPMTAEARAAAEAEMAAARQAAADKAAAEAARRAAQREASRSKAAARAAAVAAASAVAAAAAAASEAQSTAADIAAAADNDDDDPMGVGAAAAASVPSDASAPVEGGDLDGQPGRNNKRRRMKQGAAASAAADGSAGDGDGHGDDGVSVDVDDADWFGAAGGNSSRSTSASGGLTQAADEDDDDGREDDEGDSVAGRDAAAGTGLGAGAGAGKGAGAASTSSSRARRKRSSGRKRSAHERRRAAAAAAGDADDEDGLTVGANDYADLRYMNPATSIYTADGLTRPSDQGGLCMLSFDRSVVVVRVARGKEATVDALLRRHGPAGDGGGGSSGGDSGSSTTALATAAVPASDGTDSAAADAAASTGGLAAAKSPPVSCAAGAAVALAAASAALGAVVTGAFDYGASLARDLFGSSSPLPLDDAGTTGVGDSQGGGAGGSRVGGAPHAANDAVSSSGAPSASLQPQATDDAHADADAAAAAEVDVDADARLAAELQRAEARRSTRKHAPGRYAALLSSSSSAAAAVDTEYARGGPKAKSERRRDRRRERRRAKRAAREGRVWSAADAAAAVVDTAVGDTSDVTASDGIYSSDSSRASSSAADDAASGTSASSSSSPSSSSSSASSSSAAPAAAAAAAGGPKRVRVDITPELVAQACALLPAPPEVLPSPAHVLATLQSMAFTPDVLPGLLPLAGHVRLLDAHAGRYGDRSATHRGAAKDALRVGGMRVVGPSPQNYAGPSANYKAQATPLSGLGAGAAVATAVAANALEAALAPGMAAARGAAVLGLHAACTASGQPWGPLLPGLTPAHVRNTSLTVALDYVVPGHADAGLGWVGELILFTTHNAGRPPGSAAAAAAAVSAKFAGVTPRPGGALPGGARCCAAASPVTPVGWAFAMLDQSVVVRLGGAPGATALILTAPTRAHGTVGLCCAACASSVRLGSAAVSKAWQLDATIHGHMRGDAGVDHAAHAVDATAPRLAVAAPRLRVVRAPAATVGGGGGGAAAAAAAVAASR